MCVLFTVALLMLPRADIPETRFDEASISVYDMIAETSASAQECRESVAVPVPRMFVPAWGIRPPMNWHFHSSPLAGSRLFRELFCTFLC